MENIFKGKTILITGGTGTIGSALVKEVLKYEPLAIRVFSRDDTKQYQLMEAMGYPANLHMLIGDVRDKERLSFAMRGVDIVLHSAALKHVSLSEYNPFEVVKTNIVGSQNVIDAAIEQKVKIVVGVSTDKAVNPTGILGTSKLMMEKLFVNANSYIKKEETRFSCVRFGNVIWSRGSVLPLWKEQVAQNKTIRVTNDGMTRFFMSQEQAARLVLRSVGLTQGGEIFIFNMPSVPLPDLARLFIEKYYPGEQVAIQAVGARQGEKMHEELFDLGDLQKIILSDGEIFIIVPQYQINQLPNYFGFAFAKIDKPLSSQDAVSLEKIKAII